MYFNDKLSEDGSDHELIEIQRNEISSNKKTSSSSPSRRSRAPTGNDDVEAGLEPLEVSMGVQSSPSVFTFEDNNKPKTRAMSPFTFLSGGKVGNTMKESPSTTHNPAITPLTSKSAVRKQNPMSADTSLRATDMSGTIVSPSSISSSGKPPRNSPTNYNIHQQKHLHHKNNSNDNNSKPTNGYISNQPIEFTNISKESGKQQQQQSRNQSPWQRFVSSTSPMHQRRMSSSSKNSKDKKSPPHTISIRSKSSSTKHDNQQNDLKEQKISDDEEHHYDDVIQRILQSVPLSPELGSVFDGQPQSKSFTQSYNGDNNIKDENNQNKIDDSSEYDTTMKIQMRSSVEELTVDIKSPASADNSIYRCDTPIIRNRMENNTPTNKDNQTKHELKIEEDDELTKDDETKQTQSTFQSVFSLFTSHEWMSIVYLSAFAIIGSTIRLFLGRIFGGDCESPPEQNDYLSPFSTCVTASGQTAQAGGALFIDLPANMVGSFFMGILTPVDKNIPSLPWLKSDHPMQNNLSMHTSIRTGLCGSLTTFSSWNTQMIIMMIGSGSNTVLGSQIAPALMGYVLGLILAVSSFLGGRQFASAIYYHRNGTTSTNVNEDNYEYEDDLNITQDIESYIDQDSITYTNSREGAETVSTQPKIIFSKLFTAKVKKDGSSTSLCDKMSKCIDLTIHGWYSPIVFTTLLFILFLVGDYAFGNKFHRYLWVTSMMAPLGTILRWQLSFYNGKLFQQSKTWKYLPAGTLLCNMLACIVSASCAAIDSKLNENDDETARLILYAIKVGFAGNLSTVSTFVKEIIHLSEKKKKIGLSYYYAFGTILICCITSLCFYGPIV